MYYPGEVTVTAANAETAVTEARKASEKQRLGLELGSFANEARIIHLDGTITFLDGEVAPEKNYVEVMTDHFGYVGATVITEKPDQEWLVEAFYSDDYS